MILSKGSVMLKLEISRHFRLINGPKRRKNSSKLKGHNIKQDSPKYKTILFCSSLSKSIQKLSKRDKIFIKSGKIERKHKSLQRNWNISAPLLYFLTKHLISLRNKDIVKISKLQGKNLSVGWSLISLNILSRLIKLSWRKFLISGLNIMKT